MKIYLIFKDNITTAFMQHADMFEPFKVVMKSNSIITVDFWNEDKTNRLIEQVSKNKELSLVACFSKDVIYWTDPNVKVVSTGTHWSILEEYISYCQNTCL